jgi:CDP-paratose 2-epimerase
MQRMLIIGGAGFIGSNAALYFRDRGWQVSIMDNLARPGTERNLQSLLQEADVDFFYGDVRHRAEVNEVFRKIRGVDAVLHLAAQVAVTTSITDPVNDFEINAFGTLNVLEAVRSLARDATLIYASTNKVYGSLDTCPVVLRAGKYEFENLAKGISEQQPVDFHSPYGCSKGAADQYVRDYARIYKLRTFVIRQSCIYGTRQYGVEDQGWLAWFTIAALQGKNITVYGDGKQVRDVLWVADLLDLYERCLSSTNESGVFNAGGGAERSISVLEALRLIELKLGRPLHLTHGHWRPGDQKLFISDNTKAFNELGWRPTISVSEGVDRLLNWVKQNIPAIVASGDNLAAQTPYSHSSGVGVGLPRSYAVRAANRK